jgi:hypothetical protein
MSVAYEVQRNPRQTYFIGSAIRQEKTRAGLFGPP